MKVLVAPEIAREIAQGNDQGTDLLVASYYPGNVYCLKKMGFDLVEMEIDCSTQKSSFSYIVKLVYGGRIFMER
ncbi:hypothetical protein GCM10011384_38320 [Psychrobacillus lasiicapitis]|nr:hypothetical protein GCM10011384_38320 [Psychrobacillus lasiicapitis]